MKIKAGDKVIVIAGKNKGKTGKVESMIKEKNQVTIEGINTGKKTLKATRSEPRARQVEVNRPLNISNVALLSADGKAPTRVGYKLTENGKIRISKRDGGKEVK